MGRNSRAPCCNFQRLSALLQPVSTGVDTSKSAFDSRLVVDFDDDANLEAASDETPLYPPAMKQICFKTNTMFTLLLINDKETTTNEKSVKREFEQKKKKKKT